MKPNLLPILLAASIGLAIGWLARGSGSAKQDEISAAEGKRASRAPSGSTGARHSASSSGSPHWMPQNERTFLAPRSESDHAEVQRLMRTAIEKEPNFHTRMKAVSDLLALMTPENAHDLRDAFLNSRKEGFWYSTERKVFLARYGEIMKGEAMEEFKDDPDSVRILESWALVAPAEAVDWVNEMPEGRRRDDATGRLIGAFGSTNVPYAIEVYDSLTPREQARLKDTLTEAALRSGGKEACSALALDLLGRESEPLQQAGRRALQKTFELYTGSEDQTTWLRGLSPEHLALLDQDSLPAEFRPETLEPAAP